MIYHLRRRTTRSTLVLCLCSLFIPFSFAKKSEEPPVHANVGYINVKSLPIDNKELNPMRAKALRDTSMTLGANGALAWESVRINNTLNQQEKYLDKVFNFNQLLIGNNVLPPVLVEANDHLSLSSKTAIRTASKTYRIMTPARFVSTAPNWREYLSMGFAKPDLPDKTLLPQSQAEANVWNQSLQEGWENGITQANEIFKINLNRLKRDYNGIVLYRKLLAQKIISAPFVAQTNLGITGNKNEIRINDKVSRITAPSEIQVNSDQWQPVFTKE